jgi:hypothetical protein
LNKFRKAISVGMSAALLASLFTAIVAAPASAAVTVAGVGAVAVGATSAGTATFTFAEDAIDSFANAGGSFDLWIGDSNDVAPVVGAVAPTASELSFSGTPSVAGSTGSLGAGATIAGNTLHVTIAGSDTLHKESIIVTGLKIKVAAGAETGAMVAQLFNFVGSITVGGIQAGGTASGTLDIGYPIGTGAVVVNLTTTGCEFVNTAGAPGAYAFATSPESFEGTTAAAAGGQQTLTLTGTTAAVHQAGEVVTQSNACAANGRISSPGSVVNAALFDSAGNPTVFPGESNSPAANLFLDEQVADLFDTTTITLTINTAGVTFSTRPVLDPLSNTVLPIPGATDDEDQNFTLTADRKSASVVFAGTAGLDEMTIYNIFYDVAATVPGGTYVEVGAALSGGLLVSPTTTTNALVGRGITATAASAPTVYIGENAQATGLVTITELQAGFFTAGVGTGTNVIEVCLPQEPFFTSPGPWAKVTTTVASGGLVLREGNVASTDNIVQGEPTFNTVYGDFCYAWFVWTASTAPSTIQIGNADFTSGPLIDVPAGSTPGSQAMTIFVGANVTDDELVATVQIATKVFRNQVVVTALSQPTIPKGATDALAGNIQVAETGIGQLKNNEQICFEVLPRTSNFTFQDTYLKALNTSDVPVATASGGLVIGSVTMSASSCNPLQLTDLAQNQTVSFRFTVMQQSLDGTGKIVVSNIHYITTADAPNGNVLVNAFGLGVAPTSVQFQSTISNARIGAVSVAEATINAGLNTRTGFGFATETVKRGAYVTIRSRANGAAAGDLVQIWSKTKTTAWKLETSRRVSPNGFMYYSGKVLNLGYRYYRVVYVSTGAVSNTVRAFGK